MDRLKSQRKGQHIKVSIYLWYIPSGHIPKHYARDRDQSKPVTYGFARLERESLEFCMQGT